ncbi:MAG TPA: helix-hairpin-helix domain-containing protein [Saprospiraceae bacterium]|nr:helix-hairpin-helix domain-containing protein [Saprospiraceae bacterium]
MISLANCILCDWWWLPWILPFLIGLLLGWALWARYKSMVADLENQIRDLKLRISKLEDELATCKSRRADLESQLALANGRIRELDLELAGKAKIEPAVASFAAAPAAKPTGFAALKEDNLQIVEGIGPKMNEVLNDHGIHTWSHLASKSPEELRSLLDTYGDKYRIIDPHTWPQQAALARDLEWEKLIALQKQLDGGKDDAIGETDSKLEKIMIKLGLMKKWVKDDLKAIEGIGPKIEELLHQAGIKTWEELANTSVDRIQSILDNAGSRYSLAHPDTWPRQARMAADAKWSELEAYQESLNGGRPY